MRHRSGYTDMYYGKTYAQGINQYQIETNLETLRLILVYSVAVNAARRTARLSATTKLPKKAFSRIAHYNLLQHEYLDCEYIL